MDRSWKQITPSGYAWEREALQFLKEQLPDHEPYHAWANFEFIATDGSINEVDVLVMTPKGLFLVEIKSHPGEISGDAGTWIHTADGRRRVFDNPRILAERKAKKLKSLLDRQRATAKSDRRIPYIGTLVFLSAEQVVNRLDGPARMHVCTRRTIRDELIKTDENWSHRRLDRPTGKLVARALEEAGIRESARMRRVGLYELKELIDESDLFQEWSAVHSETQLQRRIRIYLTHGKTVAEAERLQRAARMELRLLEGIEHPGILRALDYQQHDHGPALIFEHDAAFVRLDHFLLERGPERRLDTWGALALLRQLAEALQYAHARRLYHRMLTPQSIFVRPLDAGFGIKIGNWSTAERLFEDESRQVSLLSRLTCMAQEEGGPYLAPEIHAAAETDPVYLDVFSLGTIAYLLFTGKNPAGSELELQDRLSRGSGLQVTDEINGASPELQDLISYATHPDLGSRIESVADFISHMNLVEEELTRPDNQRISDPTQARPGDSFGAGIIVKERLGRGASAVTYLVEHHGARRVLKLAADIDQNRHLEAEAETLDKLRHQSIIALHESCTIQGHAALLIDAADETLARRLRGDGPVQPELLERFGDDLLGALCYLEEKGIAHRDIKPENIGLVMQGNRLHLVLFDFSLATVSADNFTAGTAVYLDPFIRDPGRRRWDDYAERFAGALTLYEMATGTLPPWTAREGQPPLVDGTAEIDPAVFDPSLRDGLAAFFCKALARDVKQRFGNAEEMRDAWRRLFLQTRPKEARPAGVPDDTRCAVEEAQLDTPIGLLPLTPQALATLSRLGVNTVGDLLDLPRYELTRMTGVGIKTRKELSQVTARLLERFGTPPAVAADAAGPASVDQLFRLVGPRGEKATDPQRERFLNEYLGRLDSDPPHGLHTVHWPAPVAIAAALGSDSTEVRDLHTRVTAAWAKQPPITGLRNEVDTLLEENGDVMTAIELAEAILLRRGCVQVSPARERWAQAVTRAAVETELVRQNPRWILRRCGRRVLVAANRDGRGEELADFAEALGQLADECAGNDPLLSPARALERVRAITPPETLGRLSDSRLLRLAVAASQNAALSSRAEIYPRGMAAERALELAQGALLGARELRVEEVHARIRGRYPEALPLPGRPQLDAMLGRLDLGLEWDSEFERHGQRGAYCLPDRGLTTHAAHTTTHYPSTRHEALDGADLDRDIAALQQAIRTALDDARFLALGVRLRHWERARQRLLAEYPLQEISFDALLVRHLRRHCETLANPPKWEVVLRADACDRHSLDWRRLQGLVARVLPAMGEEIRAAGCPVLLTDPGLLARYDLVNGWLADLREQLLLGPDPHALLLLIATDVAQESAMIDQVAVPTGAGSREYLRVPGAWLQHPPGSQGITPQMAENP